MKILFVLLPLFVLSNAIALSQTILFQDNFDSYTAGQYLAVQSERWTTWSGTKGGSDDGLVVSEKSLSAPNSVLIQGATDLVLRFGDKTEKKYEIKFNLFIETGYGGYYNLLHQFDAGGQNAEWAIEVYFANNGTGFINAGGSNAATFNYSQNSWFECSNIIDLEADSAQLFIGGTLVHSWQWSLQAGGQLGVKQLAALDIYAGAPTGQTPKFYVDDLSFIARYAIYDHDVAAKKILGEDQFNAGETYFPQVLVKNEGRNAESFDVTCEILDFENGLLYNNTQAITGLEPDSAKTVEFGTLILPAANQLYRVNAFTSLAGDLDTSNDTTSKYLNTYTAERNSVVLEIGTGTWCSYCPGAAMGANELIANGQGVAVIEYHRGDNYENSYAVDRIGYYGITGYPTAVFDGIEYLIGGSNTQSQYQRYLPVFTERKAMRSAFDIDLSGKLISGNDYSLVVMAYKLAPILNQDLVLRVALTESSIPEKWQGQNQLNFVERLMLPDANGTPFTLNVNDTLRLPFRFNKQAAWVSEHCEIVAFIQDIQTREILQAAKVSLNNLAVGVDDKDVAGPPIATELWPNYPNPFNLSTTIRYSLASAGEVSLAVYNVKGQKVRTLVNAFKNAGEHTVFWDGKDEALCPVSSGIYLCKLRAGREAFIQKMVLTK